MNSRVLISGSVAYDTIMVFDGYFRDHILPDRVHMLNVAFLTPQLKREFGGTAANIAFNLKALGGEPVVLASVGRDGEEYLARLRGFGIDVSRVKLIEEAYTAQAFITTDLADNQITAFHPGAMGLAHEVSATQAVQGGAAWGIVAPNGKQAMLQHAQEFAASGVPFIFDPGQGLPMFEGSELHHIMGRANAVTVNDYEAKMLSDKTSLSEESIAAKLPAFIVTRGAEGSTVYVAGVKHEVAVSQAHKTIDPTGCGDAFRGGLLYGLAHGWDWVRSARLGSVIGAIKIEHSGPQNHHLDRAEISARYQSTYSEALRWS
jgi:adenosine kinase